MGTYICPDFDDGIAVRDPCQQKLQLQLGVFAILLDGTTYIDIMPVEKHRPVARFDDSILLAGFDMSFCTDHCLNLAQLCRICVVNIRGLGECLV